MNQDRHSTSGKPKLLTLDHNEKTLHQIRTLLAGVIEVLPVKGWEHAKQVLIHDTSIVVVIVDQVFNRMDAEPATILHQIRKLRPKIRRVLMTEPDDIGGLLEGLHSGEIERVVYKPFDRRQLVSSFVTAMPAVLRSA